MPPRTRALAISVAVLLAVFAALQAALPPDGFFCGDQGAKYLQTHAFAQHGPLRPGIDAAARDIDPAFDHQMHLELHRGQLVGVFSWLLPLLAAPFVAAFGDRGLYVIPALAAVVLFLASAALGRRLTGDDGVWIAWVVVLCAPIIFYGAELWEHAPAAACVAVAAALLVPGSLLRTANRQPPTVNRELPTANREPSTVNREPSTVNREPSTVNREPSTVRLRQGFGGTSEPRTADAARTSRRGALAAGALIGVAALFREEAALALPALIVARAIALRSKDGLKETLKLGVFAALGTLAVFLLAAPMNVVVYGSWMPLHVAGEAGKINANPPARGLLARALLLPARFPILFVVCAVVGVIAAFAARRRRTNNAAVAIAAGCTLAMLVIAVGIPIWRMTMLHESMYQAFNADSIAHTWVFCIALVLVPLLGPDDLRGGVATYLCVAAALMVAGALAVIPSTGGAQWSPRYLLSAAPRLAVVAAAAARRISGLAPRQAHLVLWTARLVLLCACAAQAYGLWFLQDAKTRNARITHKLAELAGPGYVVISDISWFPQVTSSLIPTRRMVFARSPDEVSELARIAAAHGIPEVSIVASTVETGFRAPGAIETSQGCTFTRNVRISLGERGLILHRYTCIPPGAVVK
jgi:hypothetical protein